MKDVKDRSKEVGKKKICLMNKFTRTCRWSKYVVRARNGLRMNSSFIFGPLDT